MNWVTVITIATLLQAVGYFLDEYHISSKSKDWARMLLMRAFIALDSISIPDLPRHVLIVLLRPAKRLSFPFIGRLLVAYMAAILTTFLALSVLVFEVGLALAVAFYFGPDLPIWAYLLAVGYVALFVCLSVPIFTLMRYIFSSLCDNRWAAMRYASPLFAVLGALLAVTVVVLSLNINVVSSWLDDFFSLALLISVLMPVVFVCLAIIISVLLKLLIDAIRWLSMLVFDAASGPTVSPFRYAATLMGVLLVGLKAIQQFTMS